MNLPSYRLHERIDHGGHSIVYRASCSIDDTSVIVKTPVSTRPSRAEWDRYRHEYAILAHLVDSPYVARPLGISSIDGCPVLITEDRGGQALESLLADPLEIDLVLQYAIAVACALSDIHRRGVIHKDINPSNLVVCHADAHGRHSDAGDRDDAYSQVQLIDFGISTMLPLEPQEAKPPALIAGTLAYISPEQTGRMNRGIDDRSDLYSLGVTLYRLITGDLPFQCQDPLAFCHSHLAQQPEPPQHMCRDVPAVLSDIVMKLLAKAPEDRYQSARRLADDLGQCLQQLTRCGAIAPFALAQHDHTHRFQIPQKLYGRERELKTLLGAFERVVADGQRRLLLVAGYSGIGKSALVHELHKPILGSRGNFLTGKFDQYKRDIPYATIHQAFRGLIRHILGQEDADIATWRQRISDAIGVNGRVVTNVIPEVELIVGPQAPVPELGPTESQNRFNLVLRDFVRVVAREESPLAIFLDDMQWADNATLQLLQSIMADTSIRHLCLLLAYRDNEVDDAHPLMLTVEAMERGGVTPDRIALGPLDHDSLRELVADTLRVAYASATDAAATGEARDADAQALELARLVALKTGGNPFFVRHFLKRLHHDGLLHYDFARGCFQCDPAEVAQRKYTDNVVDHLVERLELLAMPTQVSLQIAACVGNTFALADICDAGDSGLAEVAASLWPAVEEGLIMPLGSMYMTLPGTTGSGPNGGPHPHGDAKGDAKGGPNRDGERNGRYRFQHDRIQQAAYSMLSDEHKPAMHLRLGRSWRRRADKAVLDSQLFDITSQLNRGVHLIEAADERRDLAQLNFRAGRRAKDSTAYAAAVQHQTQARMLLTDDAWTRDYDLVLAVCTELAICLYLHGQFAAAEALFLEVIEHARTVAEKARIYILRIRLYQVSGNYQGGVDLAIEALELLGIRIPGDPEELARETEAAYRHVEVNLKGRRIDDLLDAPIIEDPMAQAIIEVANGSLPCSYIARPEYFPWFELLALNTLLKHGNCATGCFVYTSYGFLLPHEPRTAYEFSKLALDLNERFQDKAFRGALLHVHGDHFNYFCNPIHSNFPILERGLAACREVGDLLYAGFIAFQIVWQFLERGDALDDVLEQSQSYAAFAAQTNNMPVLETIRMEQQFIACLRGNTRSMASFSSDGGDRSGGRNGRDGGNGAYDEDRSLSAVTEAGFGCGIAFFHIMKQMLHFHCGDYAASLAAAERAQPALGAVRAMPIEVDYYVYRALAQCGRYEEADAESQARYRSEIDSARHTLAIWAESCPENFRARYLLLLAEIARIGCDTDGNGNGNGNDMLALTHYERAIEEAGRRGVLHIQGLAEELAGRFCLARNLKSSGRHFIEDARDCYERWGADGLVTHIVQRYPALLARQRPKILPVSTTITSTNSFVTTSNLDISSVLKATQALSGELQLDKLIPRLLSIAMENAGADHGLLLMVEADGTMDVFDASGASSKLGAKLDTDSALPRSVINVVQRTGQRLLLAAAADSDSHGTDPYIAQKGIQSLLCLPIVRQGQLMGLLYLENSLLADAFSANRVAILEVIATQAAISLENATLYRDSEQLVAERTRELRQAHGRLVHVAHQAGMAEIASNVLHNMGNALTGINIGLEHLQEEVLATRVDLLLRSSDLLQQHADDLAAFLTMDRRGKLIPTMIDKVSTHLNDGRERVLHHLEVLQDKVIQLNTVLHMQNKYATASQRLTESCLANEIIDDALQICAAALSQNRIAVRRQYTALEPIKLERHRILQILINLISNAVHAMMELAPEHKRVLTVRVGQSSDSCIFEVEDTGAGVDEDIRHKIFTFGFTTRPNRHGIGLHASATDAQAMSGSLHLDLSGEEGGARFVLTLPRDTADSEVSSIASA